MVYGQSHSGIIYLQHWLKNHWPITDQSIKPNLNQNHRLALKQLRDDDSIVILPADKGNVTVVMERSVCREKIKEILSDGNYSPLRKDPTRQMEWWLNKYWDLKRIHELSNEDQRRLDPNNSAPLQIYGLPKIHL